MKTFVLAASLATGIAVPALSAQLGGDPGPIFPLPESPDYYHWTVDMSGFQPGDTLLDFTVLVPFPDGHLLTFQVFGGCDGGEAFAAGFSLFRDNAPAPWSSATRGNGSTGCGYHNLFNQTLPGGDRPFKVVFDGADFPPPDGLNYADVRFGWIPPAIPLPAPITLLVGSLAILGALGSSQRVRK